MQSSPLLFSEELKHLHNAIALRDINKILAILEKLLPYIDTGNAMAMAVSLVQDYLPIFEANHPESKWPRHYLEIFIDTSPTYESDIFKSDIPELLEIFSSPGTGNFINAIEELWIAARHIRTSDPVIPLVVDALANVVTADKATFWYKDRIDKWINSDFEFHEGDEDNQDSQDKIIFKGNMLSVDGKEKAEIEGTANLHESVDLGTRAAMEILQKGGQKIIEGIRNAAK